MARQGSWSEGRSILESMEQSVFVFMEQLYTIYILIFLYLYFDCFINVGWWRGKVVEGRSKLESKEQSVFVFVE